MENYTKTIQVQSVIYGNEVYSLVRAIKALKHAVVMYHQYVGELNVKLIYGDASPEPVFNEEKINNIYEIVGDVLSFEYKKFGFNSGTAKGHNMMAEDCDAEYMLIMNPDIILEPMCLIRLMNAIQTEGVAMVEARQTPLEHAKEYDEKTGETEWASTACTVFTTKSYKDVGGFDADTFFLYCDDLDFSWRIRLAGYKILYVPSAIVYHSKNLSVNASWKPTKAEIYYSAEAAILLAYKWSNPKRVKFLLESFECSGEESTEKAVKEFKVREKEGRLPTPIDPDHKIAKFLGDEYCEMRFKING